MKTAIITKALCEIAKTFGERGDVSVITLLKESGYLQAPEKITEEKILEYLRHNPALIDTWVLYSENQRTSQAWYLKSPAGNDSSFGVWNGTLGSDLNIEIFSYISLREFEPL